MTNKERLQKIRLGVSPEKRLLQLAEECSEGSQAALKLVRAYAGEKHLSSSECRVHLIEELTDILICMDVYMTDLDKTLMDEVYEMKLKRWEERLNADKS